MRFKDVVITVLQVSDLGTILVQELNVSVAGNSQVSSFLFNYFFICQVTFLFVILSKQQRDFFLFYIHAILNLLTTSYDQINDNNFTCVILIDFQKPFDTVFHASLGLRVSA